MKPEQILNRLGLSANIIIVILLLVIIYYLHRINENFSLEGFSIGAPKSWWAKAQVPYCLPTQDSENDNCGYSTYPCTTHFELWAVGTEVYFGYGTRRAFFMKNPEEMHYNFPEMYHFFCKIYNHGCPDGSDEDKNKPLSQRGQKWRHRDLCDLALISNDRLYRESYRPSPGGCDSVETYNNLPNP